MTDIDPAELKTRKQADVSLDKIGEALEHREYEDAHAAGQRLLQRIEKLMDLTDD